MSCTVYRYGIVLMLILLFIFDTSCVATGWKSQVRAGGDFWSIERNSDTLTMLMQGTVSGSITDVKVTPSGRMVKNVASRYSSMKVNDVGSAETLSAREGRIILNENTILFSNDQNDFYRNSTYTDGVYFSESHEEWPAIFKSRNQIRYKGLGLNDFGYIENTYDRLGENSLYNKNFEKNLYVNASLIRFNATVRATDWGLEAELLPTLKTDYRLNLNTSGITDLHSRILDSNYDTKHRIYLDSMRSQERYVGDYSINRSIQYKSSFERPASEDGWLPCCLLDDKSEWPQFNENQYFNIFEV